MSKEQKNENLPAEYEVIKSIDDRDDSAIVQMMTGQAIQDYVYSFRQGGKTVEGLTLAGINEAANRRGGIEVDEIRYEERDRSWLVVVKATDTITGSSRYGACEQSKMMGSRNDVHAFTKAIHKAQRNAIKQLLPLPVIKEVLNFYLHGGSKSLKTVPKKKKSGSDKISVAQKGAFAVANKLKSKLEKAGFSQEDFWSYVKRKHTVESRNEMTESQWAQLQAELNAAEKSGDLFRQMVDRMRKLNSATEASEISEKSEDRPF